MKKDINYSSSALKQRLWSENLLPKTCQNPECPCKNSITEQDLELHHINGDHYDNRLENLQILCTLCHSCTDNFRGRNEKREEPLSLRLQRQIDKTCICENCGKTFISDRLDKKRRFCCRECYNEFLQKH